MLKTLFVTLDKLLNQINFLYLLHLESILSITIYTINYYTYEYKY